MTNLHMEALSDLELAEVVDQALASLNARLSDPDGDYKLRPELADAIGRACDAWDEVADELPGFREEA